MTLYPEVKKKVQKQLDAALRSASGSEPGYLPTLSEDADRLPYLTAVVYETLRWSSIAPLGVVSRIFGRRAHSLINLLQAFLTSSMVM
jgi:cytochrome P450